MAFRLIKPCSRRFHNLDDAIRVGFLIKNGSTLIKIHYGINIARKFGLNKGTRVVLLADPEVMRLQIEKNIEGFKIGQLGKQLYIQARWPYKTENFGKGLRFVTPTIIDGNLEVNLPKANYDDNDSE